MRKRANKRDPLDRRPIWMGSTEYWRERAAFRKEYDDKMLILTHEVNMMLRYAATYRSGYEVGGFGHSRLNDVNDIIVDDIYIPPQIVQQGHTDIKGPAEEGGDGMLEGALFYFATHCGECAEEQEGHDDERANHSFRPGSWSDWRLWWHSHGTLGTTPSQVDHNSLFGVSQALGGWAVGLVIDSKGGRYSWVAVTTPFKLEQAIDLGILNHEDEGIKARIDAMMAHVEEKKWVSHTPAQQPATNGYRGPYSGNGGTTPNSKSPADSTPTGQGSNKQEALPGVGGTKNITEMNEKEFLAWLSDHQEEAAALLGAGDE